jgi:folate-dependent phosphoribosylglycinamide formyltransferase PurN
MRKLLVVQRSQTIINMICAQFTACILNIHPGVIGKEPVIPGHRKAFKIELFSTQVEDIDTVLAAGKKHQHII